MTIPLFLVSTFTTEFFRGNPAAVCLLDAEASYDEVWYARVAALLGQPATAFCQPSGDGYRLRWFTPSHELGLCGHGTLAATHVLYETGGTQDPIAFATGHGRLDVHRDVEHCWVGLPTTRLDEARVPSDVLEALGLTSAIWYGHASADLVVIVDSVARVEGLRPDLEALERLPTTRTTVTAAGSDGTDFVSRVFPPRIGVAEDQVTGTAHAALGPIWGSRLGKQRLTARQASARGGDLVLDLSVDGIVQVGGKAVTVARGELSARV